MDTSNRQQYDLDDYIEDQGLQFYLDAALQHQHYFEQLHNYPQVRESGRDLIPSADESSKGNSTGGKIAGIIHSILSLFI
ncbi:hypothetical protein [Pedobacter jeongneungensis]|uniref:hypothetical protein n=1 Tax=Pedobacter jeongneungensis TaxID=947309 RepID=UPI000468C99E|nr:hypothetical protein [Pedobacter jeongneungensis]